MATLLAHPDQEYMLAALKQARLALEAGNLPVGAAIVHDGEVIALGCNAIDNPPNDTRHAELSAIQDAAAFLAAHKHQCTIYTTLEPCMMCLGAIINVGIDSLVIGASDSYVGAVKLLPHGEYYQYKAGRLRVTAGFMAAQCQALLNEYVRRTGLRSHLASDQTGPSGQPDGPRPASPAVGRLLP